MNNNPISVPVAVEECVNNVRTALLATLQNYKSSIVTINYMYGNILEIQERIAEYTKSSTKKLSKFPAIFLLEDITIDRRNTNYYGVTRNMEIIIAMATSPKLTSAEREDANFKNILRPIYRQLLYEFSCSKAFAVQSEMELNHVLIERKYWGSDENTSNKLGDYIDAIHMTNIEIPIRLNWRTSLTGISTG